MALASEQLKRRALHRAFYIVGTPEALATVLRLPVPELMKLLSGRKEIPQGVFLTAIDFILGHPEGARLHPRFDAVEPEVQPAAAAS